MGNVHMEATQINYRGGASKMNVEDAIKSAIELTPEQKTNINKIPTIEAAVATKTDQTVIAPEFDSESGIYAIGDLVMHEGKLYEFTSAHETAGDWNSEEVTEKTVADEVDSLKSGLTNYENQNNLNLEVANRKNLLPMKVSTIKSINTSGTWSGDTYTLNGMTFTVTGDADDNLTSVTLNDKATANCYFMLNTAVVFDVDSFNSYTPSNKYKAITGTGSGGDVNSYSVVYQASNHETYIRVAANYTSDNIALTPMITELWVTDPTFAPYIPSVDSRIEGLESGLDDAQSDLTNLIANINQLKVQEFDIASQASKKIKVNGTAIIFSDRGALIIKGPNNRGVQTISSSAATVTDVNQSSFTITSSTGGSTNFIALCRYGVEVTNVE